jgi:hypothetical protein
VVHTSDVLDAIRKVVGSIVDGVLQIRECSEAQVKIAQMTLPVRPGGLRVHLMSACDCSACDAPFVSSAALMWVAVKGGSELFSLFQGACGAALAEMWTNLLARVAICMKESSVARLDAVLSDDMIEGLLPGFAHAVSSELGEVRQKLLTTEAFC